LLFFSDLRRPQDEKKKTCDGIVDGAVVATLPSHEFQVSAPLVMVAHSALQIAKSLTFGRRKSEIL